MRDPIWHYKFQVTKDKDFLLYQLRKLDTFGIFVAFLEKRDGYGDVLFAFLDVKPYLKKESTLTRKKKQKKKTSKFAPICNRVGSSERVSVPLKWKMKMFTFKIFARVLLYSCVELVWVCCRNPTINGACLTPENKTK